jgi:hypothetical protein
LGFIVSRTAVGFDIAFEALNKDGNLFEGFFHGRIESIIGFWKKRVKKEDKDFVGNTCLPAGRNANTTTTFGEKQFTLAYTGISSRILS